MVVLLPVLFEVLGMPLVVLGVPQVVLKVTFVVLHHLVVLELLILVDVVVTIVLYQPLWFIINVTYQI